MYLHRITAAMALLSSSVVFGAAPDLSQYEHLRASDKELGQLRWAEEWANLTEPEFFAQIPPTQLEDIPLAPKSLTVQEERYIISFWTYVLALEQFNKFNAMPDMFKETIDTYIQRMQHYNASWYWEETSQFGAYGQEPFSLNNNTAATGGYLYPYPYSEEKDPVRIRNTMYKNHLTQMIGLYQKLYGDYKYSEPNSITFTDSDGMTYQYSQHDLIDLTYWEMKKEDAPRGPNNTNFFQELAYGNEEIANACIECEPNMCWAPCNTHVMISLKLYDDQFGTSYFEDIKPEFKEWMDSKNIYVEDDPNPDAAYRTSGWHTLKQDETLHPAEMGTTWWENLYYMGTQVAEGYPAGMLAFPSVSSANEGWTVTMMNAFSEDIWGNQRAQDAWSTVKARHYFDLGPDSDGDYVAHAQDGYSAQIATPFFAALAGEAGDYQARNRMVTWSDKEYLGQWGNNGAVIDSPFSADAYWYPPEARGEHLVSPLYLTGVVGNNNCDNSLFWEGYSWSNFGQNGGGMDLCSQIPSSPLYDASAYPATQGAVAWTGTLVALARANTDNGMRDLVQSAYIGMKPTTPKVRGIDWPNVKVRRAIYDEVENTLIVTTGGGQSGTAIYEIYNLDPKSVWALYIDSVEAGVYFNTDTINVVVPHDGQDHDVVLVKSSTEGESDVLIRNITDLGGGVLQLTVSAVGECTQYVDINGAIYVPGQNGQFVADIDTNNISDVNFTSYDCDSNANQKKIRLSGETIDNAVNARYNHSGVWAMGDFINNNVDASQIHSEIKSYNSGKLYDGILFDIKVDQSGDYSHESTQLNLIPVDNTNEFDFSFNVNDLSVDVYKQSCGFCGKDYGYLTVDDVYISGRVQVSVTNNIAQVSIVSISSQATVSDLHGIGGLTGLLADILGDVDEAVESAVDTFSSDLVETAGADAINSLPVDLDIQVGSTTVGVSANINSLFNTYSGTSVQFDGISAANNAEKIIVGSQYESQLIPDGRVSPSGIEHEAVVVVSSNMINQFYSELDRAGEFTTEIDILSEFMGWFGEEWSSPPTAAKLKLRPISSPYVTFTDTAENLAGGYSTQGSGRVFLDGFEVAVEVKESASSEYEEIGYAFVSASVAMDLSVNIGTNKLQASFSSLADRVIHEVHETQAEKINESGLINVVDHAVNQVIPNYGNQLGSIELPELDGFRLNPAEVWTINRANIAFGGTVIVE